MAPLEVHDLGDGDPVLLVQTGLTADELLPLARCPSLTGWRRLLPHRRGYAGSGPAAPYDFPAGSIAGEAADCVAVLDRLGLPRAHVVGYSYSGAIALQLAADRPDLVHSIALVEPPPTITVFADEFRAVNEGLFAVRRAQGVAAALDAFLQLLPGEVDEQVRADAATFFDHDLPALLAWRFTADDAERVVCPVLHVGASESGPWWAAVREQVLGWFPEASDVVVHGADHGLVVTHAEEVAAALATFWRAHS